VIARLLESGYWHVRLSRNQFFQWPASRAPRLEDGFGWVTDRHVSQVEKLTCGLDQVKATVCGEEPR
jgi:hypothetical protein